MSSPHPIVALWCVPRSISTAFERMVAARGDFKVVSEPFSDSYYFGEDRRSTRFDPEPGVRYQSFEDAMSALQAAAQDGPVFVKDMASHASRHLSQDFLSSFTNIVLIRDPRLSLVSLYKRMPDFTMEEAGFEALIALVTLLDKAGKSPFIMDGELLRARPETVCRDFCNAVDIPFQPGALSWKKGDEQHWERWQDWFSEASDSTQFLKPSATFDEETLSIPHVRHALELCNPAYRALRSRLPQRGSR